MSHMSFPCPLLLPRGVLPHKPHSFLAHLQVTSRCLCLLHIVLLVVHGHQHTVFMPLNVSPWFYHHGRYRPGHTGPHCHTCHIVMVTHVPMVTPVTSSWSHLSLGHTCLHRVCCPQCVTHVCMPSLAPAPGAPCCCCGSGAENIGAESVVWGMVCRREGKSHACVYVCGRVDV